MMTIQWAYSLTGLMFGGFAIFSAFDRSHRKRLGNAAFWGLMALSYTPTDADATGYHEIRVSVVRNDAKNLKIRARPGYYLAPPES